MAVIGTDDYRDIMGYYSDAQTQLAGLDDYYYNAAYEVVLLQAFDPEIDLLVPFYNAYLTSTSAYGSAPQAIVQAVKSLQDHILSKGRDKDTAARYTEIDDYYADYSTVFTTGANAIIPATFAALSSQAGHVIGSTYVIS